MEEGTFTFLGERSFEAMDLPKILYKYRDWKNPFHRKIITQKEVYFSPPSSFEDEFDCKIPIRYDLLTSEDIFQKYLLESKQNNPNFNREQHRRFANDWKRKGLLTNKKRIAELGERFFEEFTNKFGILCLTPFPDNKTMWEKYAAHHSGICVGFHTIPLLELRNCAGGGSEVLYYDELPILRPFDDMDKNHFLQIYSKLKKWEFEKEYRLTKINIQKRNVVIPENIFAEIIIGAQFGIDEKEDFLKLIKEKFTFVKVKQARIFKDQIIMEDITI